MISPEEKERLVKKQRRQGLLLSSVTSSNDEETEQNESVATKMISQHVPHRALTINYGSTHSRKAVELRRQSLCMLKQGHTGEGGSRKFRAALRKDSVNEVHPGWESIRKLSKVVG